MNWYIGQKIVAIRTHSQSIFKQGDIFSIKGLKQGCCGTEIDIGTETEYKRYICGICRISKKSNGIWWFLETSFAPLDEMTAHESAIKELLKENEIHENLH